MSFREQLDTMKSDGRVTERPTELADLPPAESRGNVILDVDLTNSRQQLLDAQAAERLAGS